MRAWIETVTGTRHDVTQAVARRVRAWIETDSLVEHDARAVGRPPRAGVD